MGPLLHAAAGQLPGWVPGPLLVRLEAADRWARIRQADMFEALLAILDRCADRAPPPTLLKGISICDEVYPRPHQRFLGDLDLLVDELDAPAVATALVELGYRPPDTPAELDYSEHHHLPPLRHPRTGVCVELHTRLFPPVLGLDEQPPFSPSSVRSERCVSSFEGRRVFRLSPELQIPYLASHWALDFVPAAGARSLLDVALLLRATPGRLDWERILGWLADRRIAAHLHVLLACLHDWKLADLPADWA
jgi:hypothetical protein